MENKKPIILALNPGSRYLGFAVFDGYELIDWGIKTINGKTVDSRKSNLKQIFMMMLEKYGLAHVVIKKLHSSRCSPCLKQLVRYLKYLARKNKIKISQYPLGEVESFFIVSEEEKKNKQLLARMVVHQYPYLQPEFEKEKTNKNSYHLRMFEAVALGVVLLNKLENDK